MNTPARGLPTLNRVGLYRGVAVLKDPDLTGSGRSMYLMYGEKPLFLARINAIIYK
jgi:hypothetical protein